MPNEEKTIELPIAWIKRLKELRKNIEGKDVSDINFSLGVSMLLGYLSSLDMYLDEE